MSEPTNTDPASREGDSLVPKLPQDDNTPFSQPADSTAASDDDSDENNSSTGRLDDTHPITDAASNIDSHELYDEGLSGAAEAEDPLSS